MFDAKSILEILMKGAQPAPPPQSQGQQGGFGGLGDILGQLQKQLGGPAGGAGAQPSSSGAGGMGGLGDILEQLQKQIGGASAPSPRAAPPASGGGTGGFGGLGDILGEIGKHMGQQSGQPAPRGAPQAPAGGSGGGLMDILGQVLGQATSGVKEGAGRIDEMTGAGSKARDAVGQATGRSPEELLAQLQQWIRENPGMAAAGAGGLGAVVLGTRTGRGVVGSAAKLGALALIGGLAYKALQNYQAGRPLISNDDPGRLLSEAAPRGTGFEPDAISNDTAVLYLRAMISAAAADGRIDAAEHQHILGGLRQAGIDSEAQAFLEQELGNPASPADLAEVVGSPQEAVQVYTAARLAIDPDTAEEAGFLGELARHLGIDADLAAHIDATANAAAA
jgi:uncharacterized membrane protein YebE (DUF533 family)